MYEDNKDILRVTATYACTAYTVSAFGDIEIMQDMHVHSAWTDVPTRTEYAGRGRAVVGTGDSAISRARSCYSLSLNISLFSIDPIIIDRDVYGSF